MSNLLYIKTKAIDMNDTKPASGWQTNVKRQTIRLAYWTLAWLVSMAVATFGPLALWSGNKTVTLIAIGANVVIGFGMIRANKNHLQSLDELQRKISLEAMGLALGVGLVVGLAYSNLDVANIIGFDAEISHLVILVALTYLAAMVRGNRKYQ